jgi:T5SS/PEP-CTERM-associated repeat protein
MPSTRPLRRTRFLLSISAAAALTSGAVAPWSLAADKTWINPAGGIFSTPANWQGGTPIPGDNAVFNLGAVNPYTVTLDVPVASVGLIVRDDNLLIDLGNFSFQTPAGGMALGTASGQLARLTVQNGTLSHAAASQIAIGSAPGSAAELTVGAGGTWSNSGGEIDVGGNAAQGSLNINGGGDVTCAVMTVAFGSTSSGVVNVRGLGSSLTTSAAPTVGANGNGAINVEGGAQLFTNGAIIGNNGPGSVSISGIGSTWSAASGSLLIAAGATSGSLTIAQGATVTAGGFTIGNSSNSIGQMSIDGVGSRLNIGSGTAFIGGSGSGSLSPAAPA